MRKRDLKQDHFVRLKGKTEKAGFVVYAAPGKLYSYHILKIIELYINRQCLPGLLGRVMMISMFTVSLYTFYLVGKDAKLNISRLWQRLKNLPTQKDMEEMTILYLQTREYKMQSNPNRDALECRLYQILYRSVEEMAKQALVIFADIFSAVPVFEAYIE